MQDFKHVRAWQRAHAMAIAVRQLTSRFRRAGHANLGSQLNRSSESIGSTIAEGCGAATNKEFARFLDMAIKSANETEHHLLAARDHGLILRDEWLKYTTETIEIRKMTYGYRRRVLQNDRAET